ncbi:uncharacterized protein BX664DRAFT_91463 [Halteromyces radiatus]|uniref:uncharacterized protein n=1 Tax=Halteromyces radiatus TaxID=101107 RepID=UPI00221F1D51|nr:uncharacterized protein BX664DRAFT_91463 [Halteromyces radiatus]KAI8092636.1 hypothetical protein BX664DRAFT_91463 [Halteromyces radiatus]
MKFTLTSVSLLAFTASIQSVVGQSACPDQAVFDLCKQNQDKYLATCAPTNYQCLCQWNKAKLSCWSSCPNDVERGTQENIVAADCSVPGANVTTSWSNTVVPTSASASATLSPSASASTSSKSNSANNHQIKFEWMMASTVLVLSAYFLG